MGCWFVSMERRELITRRGVATLTVLISVLAGVRASEAQVPASPTALTSTVDGTAVTVAWVGDQTATAYRIQVGTTPGASDLFDGVLPNVTTASGNVPAGLYFWRVIALNAFGSSAPSGEAQFSVGSGCVAPPAPPQGFLYTVDGANVTLQWAGAPSGDSATTFLIEAGSAPGLADLYTGPTGALSQLTVAAPPGVYFVRVRARNNCGLSGPSNEQRIVVGQGSVACSYALTPPTPSLVNTGGFLDINVLTQPGCPWSAVTDQPWLQVIGSTQGVGPGATTVLAAPNGSAARIGQLGVGTAIVQIVQSGASGSSPLPTPNTPGGGCTYSVTPGSQNVSATGGTFTIQISTAAGCAWQATVDAPWLGFASASVGSGSATVSYSVASNSTGNARAGRVIVVGASSTPPSTHVVNVGQAGVTTPPCAYTISPQAFTATTDGGLFSTQISAAEGCVWFASATQSWLTLTGTNSSSVSGTVGFAVAANNDPARTGSILVSTPSGDFPVSISQVGFFTTGLTASFTVTPNICHASGPLNSVQLFCTFDGTSSTPSNEIVSYTWHIGALEFSGPVLQNPVVGSFPAPSGVFVRDVTLIVKATRNREATITRPVTFVGDGGAVNPCLYGVSPGLTTVPAAGGTFEFQVSTISRCDTPATWYPAVLAPTSSWITVVSPTSGRGTGTVRYTVAPNTTGASRSGTIRIFSPGESVPFTVTQLP